MGKLSPKQLIKKVKKLESNRSVWETHWRDIAFYFQPNRREIHEQPAKGNRRHNNLLDNTGVQSVELLASGLQSMLTNPNVSWFELTTGDERLDDQDGIRQWLQENTLSMFNVLNNSNFNTEVHQMYIDLISFGTSSMLEEEDDETIVRFYNQHIKNIMIEENHLGFVDRVYIMHKWTAENMISEYGIDNVSKKVRDAFQKHEFDKEFEFIHAVYPKNVFSGETDKLLPYVSQHVEVESENVLREGGYRQYPYMTPRWTKTSQEVYGRSPSMVALPDMKTLNVMTETMLIAAQKVADPPLQAPDDGVSLPVITRPGGMTYVREGSDPIRPLFNQIPIDFGFQSIEDRRQRIRGSFFVDQLQLQQGPQMTATEVMQRTEEKNRLLGPILGRMQSEFLRPLINRTFDIMLRKDLITDPPPELEGANIDVKYSSMIARSQKIGETQNILRTLEAAGPFIQLDPSVADMFNGDEILRVVARALNFPQRGIRNSDEVDQVRQARAEAQQAALEQERANQQADRVSKVGPAVAANTQQ